MQGKIQYELAAVIWKHSSTGSWYFVSLPEHLSQEIRENLKWQEVNREYAEKWPNITVKREPPADGEKYDGEEGKFDKCFSPEPGEGD